MSAPNRISFEKIVNALNKDELIDYCQSYQIDVSNIKYARNLNFYRRGLINAMEKEHNTKDINIKSFVKSFATGLSHDTIIKIYPNYDNYKAEMKIKKEQRKFIKDTKEQEANYEDAYVDYYTSPHKKEPSQVHKIEYLTEEEIRRQKDKQIMKALIAQRKKEDFERFNKDKINSSPFTEKIDAIKATVEKQLRKLRELEEQDNEWRQAQKLQQEQENDY